MNEYMRMADRMYDLENQMKQLEKENAELKETINYLNPCGDWNDDVHDCEFRHYAIEYSNQLTKAKEIIKNLMVFAEMDDREYEKEYKEAEQFLKGEATTELSNECHDCAKFDEMPKGPRCKTCDNGSHFQKKEEKNESKNTDNNC